MPAISTQNSASLDSTIDQSAVVWIAPSLLRLDVANDTTTSVVFCRSPNNDNAVRLSYTINGKPDTAAIASISHSTTSSMADFTLRTPSSPLSSLVKIGQSALKVAITIEIADSCQNGLSIAVCGTKSTHIDFRDEFLHPFGDVDVLFVSRSKMHIRLPAAAAAARDALPNFAAHSLRTRSFKFEGSSQDMRVQSLAADDGLSVVASSGSVTIGSVDAGGRGLLVDVKSGDVCLHSISGTKALIHTSSGDVLLSGAANLTRSMGITTASGSVKAAGAIRSAKLSVRSSSGDITYSGLECDSVTLESGSGLVTSTVAPHAVIDR